MWEIKTNKNWIELNWIELNWIELNWIELNWIEHLQKPFDSEKFKPWALTLWNGEWWVVEKKIVHVNKVDSDPIQISCGFHMALLGPHLFLCYVNDMPAKVDCKLLLYADDVCLFVCLFVFVYYYYYYSLTKILSLLQINLVKKCSHADNGLLIISLHNILERLKVSCLAQKYELKKVKKISVVCDMVIEWTLKCIGYFTLPFVHKGSPLGPNHF